MDLILCKSKKSEREKSKKETLNEQATEMLQLNEQRSKEREWLGTSVWREDWKEASQPETLKGGKG